MRDNQGGIRAVLRPGRHTERHTERQMSDLGGIRAVCRLRSHMWDNQGGIRADSRPGRDKRVVNGI